MQMMPWGTDYRRLIWEILVPQCTALTWFQFQLEEEEFHCVKIQLKDVAFSLNRCSWGRHRGGKDPEPTVLLLVINFDLVLLMARKAIICTCSYLNLGSQMKGFPIRFITLLFNLYIFFKNLKLAYLRYAFKERKLHLVNTKNSLLHPTKWF